MKGLGLRLHADEEHWIPLSDMMTGLMFLFLLIALAYMVEVKFQQAHAQRVAGVYAQTHERLYRELDRAFHADLAKWGADIDEKTLAVRFNSPDVLFTTGSAELRPRFKAILDDFFPRYVRILSRPEYRQMVSEIRIEGYTSAGWAPGASELESYLGNMDLSQARTRAVLGYVLPLPAVAPQRAWLMQVLTANGLSFSHLLRHGNGTVDQAASQRVEFRVETDADERLRAVAAITSPTPQPSVSAQQRAATGPVVMTDYPAWSRASIGKKLHALYPATSSQCEGFMDSFSTASPDGTQSANVSGWAYDRQARRPVGRIVLVDGSGRIVGAGDGGQQRLDVPAVHHEIRSDFTGWSGYAGPQPHSVQAWAVLGAPGSVGTVCRLTGLAF